MTDSNQSFCIAKCEEFLQFCTDQTNLGEWLENSDDDPSLNNHGSRWQVFFLGRLADRYRGLAATIVFEWGRQRVAELEADRGGATAILNGAEKGRLALDSYLRSHQGHDDLCRINDASWKSIEGAAYVRLGDTQSFAACAEAAVLAYARLLLGRPVDAGELGLETPTCPPKGDEKSTIRACLATLWPRVLPDPKEQAYREWVHRAARAMAGMALRFVLGHEAVDADNSRRKETFVLTHVARDQEHSGSYGRLVVTRDDLQSSPFATFYPDPIRLGYLRHDREWFEGFRRAWTAATDLQQKRGGTLDGTYRWALEFRTEDGLRRPAVVGENSASASAACCLLALARNRTLNLSYTASAAVDEKGELQGVGGLYFKVAGQTQISEPRVPPSTARLYLAYGNDSFRDAEWARVVAGQTDGNFTLKFVGSEQKPGTLEDVFEQLTGDLDRVKRYLKALRAHVLRTSIVHKPAWTTAPGSEDEVADRLFRFCIPPRGILREDYQQAREALERIAPATAARAGTTPMELLAQMPLVEDKNLTKEQRQELQNTLDEARPRRLDWAIGRYPGIEIVEGEPGEGKTVALGYLVASRCQELWEALESSRIGTESEECVVPIWIPLNSVAPRSTESLSTNPSCLLNGLAIHDQSMEIQGWLERRWKAGKVLLILDALDEYTGNLTTLHNSLLGLSSLGVPIVVATRPYALLNNAWPQPPWLLCPFGRFEQQRYIRGYFSGDEDLSSEISREILWRNQDLMRLPLFLGSVCRLVEKSGSTRNLPETRTGLVRDLLQKDLLLRSAEKENLKTDDPKLTEANVVLERILRHIAWQSYGKGPMPISARSVDELLKSSAVKHLWHEYLGLAERTSLPASTPTALLDRLVKDGVLVPLGATDDLPEGSGRETFYRFALRTLHEYLVGGYIAQECEPIRSGDEVGFKAMIVGRAMEWGRGDDPHWRHTSEDLADGASREGIKPLNQPSWRNVWPFVAGTMAAHWDAKGTDHLGWFIEAILADDDVFGSHTLQILPPFCGEVPDGVAERDELIAPVCDAIWDIFEASTSKHQVQNAVIRLSRKAGHALEASCRRALDALVTVKPRNCDVDRMFRYIRNNRPHYWMDLETLLIPYIMAMPSEYAWQSMLDYYTTHPWSNLLFHPSPWREPPCWREKRIADYESWHKWHRRPTPRSLYKWFWRDLDQNIFECNRWRYISKALKYVKALAKVEDNKSVLYQIDAIVPAALLRIGTNESLSEFRQRYPGHDAQLDRRSRWLKWLVSDDCVKSILITESRNLKDFSDPHSRKLFAGPSHDLFELSGTTALQLQCLCRLAERADDDCVNELLNHLAPGTNRFVASFAAWAARALSDRSAIAKVGRIAFDSNNPVWLRSVCIKSLNLPEFEDRVLSMLFDEKEDEEILAACACVISLSRQKLEDVADRILGLITTARTYRRGDFIRAYLRYTGAAGAPALMQLPNQVVREAIGPVTWCRALARTGWSGAAETIYVELRACKDRRARILVDLLVGLGQEAWNSVDPIRIIREGRLDWDWQCVKLYVRALGVRRCIWASTGIKDLSGRCRSSHEQLRWECTRALARIGKAEGRAMCLTQWEELFQEVPGVQDRTGWRAMLRGDGAIEWESP